MGLRLVVIEKTKFQKFQDKIVIVISLWSYWACVDPEWACHKAHQLWTLIRGTLEHTTGREAVVARPCHLSSSMLCFQITAVYLMLNLQWHTSWYLLTWSKGTCSECWQKFYHYSQGSISPVLAFIGKWGKLFIVLESLCVPSRNVCFFSNGSHLCNVKFSRTKLKNK